MSSDHVTNTLIFEQATAVAWRASMLAIGSILAYAVVLAEFWPTPMHHRLLDLLALLIVLHVASTGFNATVIRRPQSVRRSTPVLQAVLAAILAAVWACVPVILMPLADEAGHDLLIYVCSGMITGGILLAPVLPAALSFAGINALGLLLATPALDHAAVGRHSVLILTFLAMTVSVAIHQSRDFARRIRNESTVRDQGDVIGMLLRDFEESASDWLWETDSELRLRRVSARLGSLLGFDSDTLQGASLRGWIGRGAREAGADKGDADRLLTALAERAPFRDLQVLVTAGHDPHWFSLTGKPVRDADGVFTGYRGVGSDITAVRRYDERIEYLARFDSLTGLPNRARFREALAEACARETKLTLLLLDLDGFKSVNDTLGHPVGDALLVEVAGRLRACLDDGDFAARLGGDEFAILQAGDDGPGAERLAQRLIASISEPYRLGAVLAGVGASVGIVFPRDARLDPEHLLQAADLALYRSKAEGRGTWHIFTPSMAARAQERQAMQSDLKRAIENDELVLDFQPILDLSTRQIIAAEALVRWIHPTRGRISPADFIPIAEDSGLILPLGAWVLRRACEQAASWESDARVAVNLSPVQFRDPGLLALIDDALALTGLPPRRLELEITESVFLDAVDATVACLNALRSRGIHVALDDFGTGYSSLSYLRSFSFDKVKIDQSFIRDLGANEDAIAIVQAIVGMAGSLGMRTTGEGVETVLQAELLQSTGCSQVQGYLFGRPCAPAQIATLLKPAGQPVRRLLEAPVD